MDAGGFEKACNSTGTETNGGYAEATFNFAVAEVLRDRLRALGAKVVMTRTRNSTSRWGPCIDDRGRFGKAHDADLTLSIHGDGTGAASHGFHVIAPKAGTRHTDDIAAQSLVLAKAMRSGLEKVRVPLSTYVPDGLDLRGDLGTLNLSDVPVVMVELGNMRNSDDAHRMTSASGRATYAAGLLDGIRDYLHR